VYSRAEVEALARFAHDRDMFLHMDGARISNAAVAQGLTLQQATRDLGVDVLSFGGTKNGLMGVEAVVFFRPELARDFLFVRKQGMHLASKMRFLAVQMEALLTNDLWRRNADHANQMAKLLESELRKIAHVKIFYPVEANGVFAKIPPAAIKKIQERYFFYPWIEEESVVRWMCSFDTTEEDVRQFVSFVAEAVG
jgi:threonine aldolase